MRSALVSVFFLPAVSAAANGAARTPPAGWRSWNYYACEISSSVFVRQIEALADRSRAVGGKPTSLADLGYNTVGIGATARERDRQREGGNGGVQQRPSCFAFRRHAICMLSALFTSVPAIARGLQTTAGRIASRPVHSMAPITLLPAPPWWMSRAFRADCGRLATRRLLLASNSGGVSRTSHAAQ